VRQGAHLHHHHHSSTRTSSGPPPPTQPRQSKPATCLPAPTPACITYVREATDLPTYLSLHVREEVGGERVVAVGEGLGPEEPLVHQGVQQLRLRLQRRELALGRAQAPDTGKRGSQHTAARGSHRGRLVGSKGVLAAILSHLAHALT
jgi:hypothetical protein